MRRRARGAVAGLVALVLSAGPAGAHSGGRAQLYVDSVRLEPQAGGWRAELVVRDADSGQPEPGVGVELAANRGAGEPLGPVALTDPDGDGRYSALVPLADGPWTITVRAEEIPGGPRALPFSRTWSATVQAGRAIDVGGAGSRTADHGGGHGPAVPLGLSLGAAFALLVGFSRFRPLRPAGRPR
ncbi:MAG: hypothetical protein AB1679_35820 [Actinomycetota bacterium]